MGKREQASALKELLQRVLSNHPAFSANPLGDWKDLVGEQVARHSQPKSLKKKVLVVVAYDPVWKHQLDLNREALLSAINRGRPEPLVEKVVVRVGEIPEEPPMLNPDHRLLKKLEAARARKIKKKKAPVTRLTPEEKALVKRLPDSELQRIFTRLLKHLPPEEPKDG